MIYWICVYPLSCLLFMIQNRKHLDEVDVSAKIGFYINGYQNSFFYWYYYFFLQYLFFEKGSSSLCIEKSFLSR